MLVVVVGYEVDDVFVEEVGYGDGCGLYVCFGIVLGGWVVVE